jgi:Flp pilus assembly protein TadG
MRHSRSRQRRGTAAVELAVALIPLMTIVMGIIEGGRMMLVQEVAGNAVREGARLAALSGSTMGTSTSSGATEVNYRVRSYMNAAGFSTGSATVTITDLDQTGITDLTQASAGDRTQVQISFPFSSVALIPPWFFGSATVKATCVMRKEGP